MDSFRVGNKKPIHFLKGQKGQSTVEYVLLLAVVVSLVTSVFNSPTFQEFFGEDSQFFNAIAERMRLDYRYSTKVDSGDDIGNARPTAHPSFSQPDGSLSRFFGFQAGGSPYPPP